jgi:hypothetical protein
MKQITIIFSLLVLTAVLSSPLSAQNETCGVIVGDALIAPGEKVVTIFGAMGFPEHIWAIRGKASQKDDYVKIDYVDYGMSFSITNGNEDGNKSNIIKTVYILKKNQKLKGIPFNIGDPYEKAKQVWGEPEKKEAGNANYFKRGVLIQVDDRGTIDLILIQKPGKIDYDEMPKNKA